MCNIMQVGKQVFLGGMFGFFLQAEYDSMVIKLEALCVTYSSYRSVFLLLLSSLQCCH